MISNEKLVRQIYAQEQPEKAFQQLIINLRPMMIKIGRIHLSKIPIYDLDDYIQEGSIVLWKLLESKRFNWKDKFSSLFYTAFDRKCINLYRDYILKNMIVISEAEDFYGYGYHLKARNVECNYGDIHVGLIISAVFAALVAVAKGWKWSYIEKGLVSSINGSMQGILIIVTTGALIGSWIQAGVIPSMIYYGLGLLTPTIFLVATCIICAIVSLSTGTSWGTAGTVGIALVGIGGGLGIPEGIAVGAVISGAYFGDKMSPLSDTTNLASSTVGVNLFEHIRHMMFTVGPTTIIALILYAIIGTRYSGATNMERAELIRAGILEQFNVSPLLILPPLLVIAMIAFKTPALPGMLFGAIIGSIFGVFFQGTAIGDIPVVWHYGFEFADPDSVMPELVDLLTRGGMDSMMWTIHLMLCALALGGVMSCTGMLNSITEALMKRVKRRGPLVLTTIITAIFINIIPGDLYLSIVMTGKMYKEAFEDMRLKPKNLSRCIEDSSTLTSNLVPWNACGAYMRGVFGIPQWGAGGYAPFAFLNLICPLVSTFYGFTGLTMEKMTEEEYQKVLEEREEERRRAIEAAEA